MNMRRLFWDNPELRRNLSLELTAGRLLWTPAFLFVAVGLCFLPDQPVRELVQIAQWVVVGIWMVGGMVWGGLRAAQSVRSERTERTWDTQRLTAMSAGEFAVGKVFGATAHSLYLQAVLTCFWAVLSLMRFQLDPTELTLRAAVVIPATLVIGSIALYSLMVAQSFLETDPARSAKSTLFSFGVPLVSAIYLASHFWSDLLLERKGWWAVNGDPKLVSWWGASLPGPELQLASLLLFLPWAWFGLWRALRRDLQHADFPWAWPAFLVFAGAYVQGFSTSFPEETSKVVPLCMIPLVVLGWGFLLTENIDPMGLRRLLDASGSWKERLRLGIPFSWVTMPLVALASFAAAGAWWLGDWRDASEIYSLLAGVGLIALRDLILFTWISCRVPIARQGLSRMALVVGLHVFLPVLSMLVSDDARMVWPFPQDLDSDKGKWLVLVNLGSLGAQAFLAWAILGPSLWRRIRKA
ncbi:MAG: hypothetical protein IPK50_00755 [Fibrobacterota bacterium]|nr:MAG: hypothetical protein IPK50_00755 [Fibrobacterota bacterium]